MAIDKKGRKLPKGIRQRSDTYEGRVTYRGRSYTIHGKTITETQKKLTDLRYKLEHGMFVESEKVTLNSWFQTWLDEYKKNRIKVGTYYSYKKYYEGMVKKRLGKTYISEIKGVHIQKLYNDLIKEEYALSSIKIISAILNGCMQQALRNGMLERNPVKLAELPRMTNKTIKPALSKSEQELFMEFAKESYLYYFFAVMLRTGLRNGEMRGLKLLDIDKQKNVLHVRRTLKYLEGQGYVEDTPKTIASKRDVPLTADMLQLLEAQRKYWGFKVEKMDRYLFCNEEGGPLSRERVKAELNRIIKKIHNAGHDFPYITPHTFRHTFATRAIEAGMQPQVLKSILGHSSLAMTMDLYSHVMPETRTEEMEKISSAFGNSM